jgi:hypothetical protein
VSPADSNPSLPPRGAADAVAAWVDGHPDDGVLHAGLDDQLSLAESALVADHVSRCATCRARVAAAHGLIASSRRIVTRAKERDEVAPDAVAAGPLSAAGPMPAASVAEEVVTSAKVAGPTEAASETEMPSTQDRVPMVPATAPASQTVAPPTAVASPIVVPAAPAASPKPVSATTLPGASVAARVRTPAPGKPSMFPWARVGSVAALSAVVLSVVLIWRSVGTDFGVARATAASSVVAARPVARPDTLGAASTAASEVSTVALVTPASAAAPSEPVVAVASANGKLDVAAGTSLAAFDSLVLTRRACASACDEFTLYMTSAGSAHYVVRSRNGQERSADANTTDASLRRLSALITRVLFETGAVPSSGRSLCTVFDASHVAALQLMVAHGSSNALHANSCLASSKVLLTLGAQIDSLAGADRLQRSALGAEQR